MPDHAVLLVLVDGPAMGTSHWAPAAPPVIDWSAEIHDVAGGCMVRVHEVYRLSRVDTRDGLPLALYRAQHESASSGPRGPPPGEPTGDRVVSTFASSPFTPLLATASHRAPG